MSTVLGLVTGLLNGLSSTVKTVLADGQTCVEYVGKDASLAVIAIANAIAATADNVG